MKKINAWLFGSLTREEAENPNTLFSSVILWIVVITIIIFSLLLGCLECRKVQGAINFLVIAGASLTGGGAIGFLFGFPRSAKYKYIKQDNTNSSDDKTDYYDNTNLEEVSDWLTKIIVGLTLIKLNTIIKWLDSASHSIAQVYSCNCNDEKCFNFYVFGYCVIILYFFAGAGLFYVWARTNLSIIFTRSKEAQLKSKNKKLKTEVLAIANKESQSSENSPPGILSKIEDVVNEPGENTREINLSITKIPSDQFRQKVETLYNSKTIFYKDDLQKGRWGGIAQKGNIKFEAFYEADTSFINLYRVKLSIRSLNAYEPLTGEIAFFLHDTFPSQIEYAIAKNNLAEISFFAWEAFVVGAMLENATTFELDLNKTKGFPDSFYWK